MGKGKKNSKSASKQNVVDVSTVGSQSNKTQELQKRNVVQEEDSESDEDKKDVKTSAMHDSLRGSDSEEDNAAAGRELQAPDSGARSKPLPNIPSSKKRNKAPPNTSEFNEASATSDSQLTARALTNISQTHPAAETFTTSFFNGQHSNQNNDTNSYLSHENLGRIIIRLLPANYQPERLPDGRYIVTAAAIGYLAQKLSH